MASVPARSHAHLREEANVAYASHQQILDRILVHLHYQVQDYRFETIEEAHPATLHWALQDSNNEASGHIGLYKWLREGDGLYWIAGKLGSGKSTLMKFLYQHPRVRQALRAWAGNSRLITIKIFLWDLGDTLQSSAAGFFRSSLSQALKQEPSLAHVLFAEQYQYGAEWSSFPTLHDLKRALDRLLHHSMDSIKIALMIDGLHKVDTTDRDMTDIVRFVMAATASPGIKALVSSSPSLTFATAFKSCPSLTLEKHTHNDITMFVNDKLVQHNRMAVLSRKQPQDVQALVDYIVENASGVFLWVTLAIQSLLEGLSQYDTFYELRERLLLPLAIEDYYEHIVRRVTEQSNLHRIEASRIIQLLVCSEREDLGPLSSDVLFSVLEPSPSSPISGSTKPIENMRPQYPSDMAGVLNNLWMGLLVIREGRDSGTIEYVHFSVRHFLDRWDVWDRITAATKDSGFDARAILVRASVYKEDHESPVSDKVTPAQKPDAWHTATARHIFLVTRSLEWALSSSSSTVANEKGKDKDKEKEYLPQENLTVQEFEQLTNGIYQALSAVQHWAIVVASPGNILAGTMFELLRSGRFGAPLKMGSIILRETRCGVPIWRFGSYEGHTYLDDDTILDNAYKSNAEVGTVYDAFDRNCQAFAERLITRIQAPIAKYHIFKGIVGENPDFPKEEAPRIMKRRCLEWDHWNAMIPSENVYQVERRKKNRNLRSFPHTLVALTRVASTLLTIAAIYNALFINRPWLMAINTLLLGWTISHARFGSLGLSFLRLFMNGSPKQLTSSEAQLDEIIDNIGRLELQALEERFADIMCRVNVVLAGSEREPE
ncbi:hypothetical protein FB567DRAFT_519252 [Paraphoma chrysanthemicola]|uniref:Nephrocystin 3-like N-terminal domain-containing protein n=1 Tax=Paraphoma chrysanthemicola TaxID=798071 RepID=A0A8K0RCL8_9PLEO|nr:hypothetical protein FB567DRAFT_519252 [Paraphoma chrysanthemicola]